MGSKIILVVVAATSWFLLLGLIRESSAELTAAVRTNKAQYIKYQEVLLDPISTWITLHVSQDVYVEPDFLQRPFEWRLNVRDPDGKRIIPTYFKENPGEDDPLPRPPREKKTLLQAGDYEVFLEDLAEHFYISRIGSHTLQFVISVSIYDDEAGTNNRQEIVSSKIDKFEVVGGAPVSVDIDPDVLSLRNKGKWLTAYISAFPTGFTAEDVDIGTVNLWHDDQPVAASWGRIKRAVLTVKFDLLTVLEMLSPAAEVELKVTGKFGEWEPFGGSDTIRVIE
jgi:hypothetical protein